LGRKSEVSHILLKINIMQTSQLPPAGDLAPLGTPLSGVAVLRPGPQSKPAARGGALSLQSRLRVDALQIHPGKPKMVGY
jgi:hypothetical protein